MKTYIKPTVSTLLLQPLQLLATSGNAFNLFNTEGDNPYDAAPPFFRTPWGKAPFGMP